MSVTSVRLNDELVSALEALAQKLDRSKNYLINQAIKDYVERQNSEAQRWQETLEALENVRSGELVDGDEVAQWLNSWGTENELSAPTR
ncbi:MAG: CopG family ribbon-helix-helix protein [Thiomicrospira sp.]|uniref:CopG family ribbon-helix-helix protein n=1 Tax=Thiomicrospira sp. TaxID=935 RepID=UPI0019F80A1A|nr:CopG family ribbon-helix-helix protein [Thiomicrospira sp.]MBE0494076.1 CopG family ribbon-helix-helix protein [Thiomicrospira sp.]